MAAAVEVSLIGVTTALHNSNVWLSRKPQLYSIHLWSCLWLQNEFIGAAAHYWECAGNWLTEDDLPVEHPPCGDDKAIFDQVCAIGNHLASFRLFFQYHVQGAFSFVKANDSITVRSLSVRGTGIQSQTELSKYQSSPPPLMYHVPQVLLSSTLRSR